MPRLLVFVACEKAIVDHSNLLSLISLMQEVNIQIPPDATVPAEAQIAAPMPWAIVSVWGRLLSDQGKTFEQRIAMFHSDGTLVFEVPFSTVDFQPTAPATALTDQHRTIGNSTVIPIQAGTYSIKTWLREKGQSDWGDELSSYPLKVNRINPS